MTEDLKLRVFRAQLDYSDIQEYTNWNHLMINDYLGITEGSLALSDQIDQNTINIATNAEAIQNLQELTAGQQVKIYSINARLGRTESKINDNTEQIAINTASIDQNTLSINDLEQLINRV